MGRETHRGTAWHVGLGIAAIVWLGLVVVGIGVIGLAPDFGLHMVPAWAWISANGVFLVLIGAPTLGGLIARWRSRRRDRPL